MRFCSFSKEFVKCYNDCYLIIIFFSILLLVAGYVSRRLLLIMSSMTKMYISLGAILLLVLASLLITFARTRTKGAVKFVLSVVAFAMLIIAMPMMVVSLV